MAALLVGCGGDIASRRHHGTSLGSNATTSPRVTPMLPSSPSYDPDHRTVADVLAAYGPYAEDQLKPYFADAGVAFPPAEMTWIALKAERKLELWARDGGEYRYIRDYAIRAASGVAGPKLRQGDKQVPEGIYQIVDLNPNSHYHLSLKLNYPNEFDLLHAEQEGRFDPGSDIFIHGRDVSVGCLAMGDSAIEELFVLAAKTGPGNVKIVIAPHDPRENPLLAVGPELPDWTSDLYQTIDEEIRRFPRPTRLSLLQHALTIPPAP